MTHPVDDGRPSDEALVAYLDGELSAAERAHLAARGQNP
jgi:anti-sigma factor RsiW